MKTLATIGYELATPATLVDALLKARIDLLVDVRAVPNSRRPGFSKKALTAATAEAGIEYLHLRGLGTPADGRAASRAGKHEVMHAIYRDQLKTFAARDDLFVLVEAIKSGRSACVLCLEASPEHCHRSLVAKAVNEHVRVRVVDLFPELPPERPLGEGTRSLPNTPGPKHVE